VANQEQLDILKQGVEMWNQWRNKHSTILSDLSAVDLTGSTLSRAYLSGATLSGADLSGSDLSGADLSGAVIGGITINRFNVIRADFSGFQRSGAVISAANLSHTDLSRANLRGAYLRGVNFSDANLSDAHLIEADLTRTDLTRADLTGANLDAAKINRTFFGDIDLQHVKGLETITHRGPSTIGIDTIYRSQGNIPEAFLKGAGLDDTFITYIRSLIGKAIEYYSCFISYSSKDEDFARRLYTDLQNNNVRCWFAPRDMRIGDKIRLRIDESIHMHDKLLLVLSEHSVASQWVEHEVETALGKELEGKPNVLFPIRLDEAVMQSKTGWASHIRLTRHIGDFTNWKSHDEYQQAFNRLLRDLKAEA
jgi:hypothetical protein